MPIVNNPIFSTSRCFAVIDREQVLRADGSTLDFQDLQNLKEWSIRNNYSYDLFEEKQWNICAWIIFQR